MTVGVQTYQGALFHVPDTDILQACCDDQLARVVVHNIAIASDYSEGVCQVVSKIRLDHAFGKLACSTYSEQIDGRSSAVWLLR